MMLLGLIPLPDFCGHSHGHKVICASVTSQVWMVTVLVVNSGLLWELIEVMHTRCQCSINVSHYYYSQVVEWQRICLPMQGDARDAGLIPGTGRSPGEGNGNPLQYSCLENPMNRGAWRATVYSVTGSDTTEHTRTNTIINRREVPSLFWKFTHSRKNF